MYSPHSFIKDEHIWQGCLECGLPKGDRIHYDPDYCVCPECLPYVTDEEE